jgi:arylsulfatase A
MSMAQKLRARKENFKHLVEHIDLLVGRVLLRLDELGLAEDTLVLFAGDNGTGTNVTTQTRTGPVTGGKGATTDAGTHVPLLVRWKGRAAAGTVCRDLVDTTDFLPTIAEAAGARLPAAPGLTLDGRSFLPQVLGRFGTPREWVFCHFDKNPAQADFNPKFPRARFARGPRFKLYDNGRLYDVVHDPLERTSVAPDSTAPDARAARAALQRVLDSMAVKPDFYTQGGVTRENNLAVPPGRKRPATDDDDP